MGYVHEREEERTGFQSGMFLQNSFDLQCDFAMVYGIGSETAARIQRCKDRGYVPHVMVGLAWGGYEDYINGEWDGINHWDEAQKNRAGDILKHGSGAYMVPTASFAKYLAEKLKVAVDAGASAIHLEEPEFIASGGYADAFKREYENYYHMAWEWPEATAQASFKSFKLMAQMYCDLIAYISSSLKEYAKNKYNRGLRVYVATHSLINYAQWKIMSPESLLLDVSSIDGYIAQVWTGTSRVKNRYQGELAERTFETAFLEYGIMQELVRGTKKRMWFLHDPVEDDPKHDWNDYEANYIKTVAASLFHPSVARYEVAPWPERVFNGVYPHLRNGAPAENAQPMPAHYRTTLCNIINMLNDMEETTAEFEGVPFSIGLILSNSFMYQRWIPENLCQADSTGILRDADSSAMSDLYGVALPLLKRGLPVRPIQLENILRVDGYLDNYQVLVLSYEYLKPETPDINLALAEWVVSGGVLVYVGDGKDCFHTIEHWWTGKYHNPAEHLFEHMGMKRDPDSGLYRIGKGCVSILKARPATLAYTKQGSDSMYQALNVAMASRHMAYSPCNYFVMRRNSYIVAACFTESVSDRPLYLSGLFVDMGKPDLPICREVTVDPGREKILFDLNTVSTETLRVVGTSLRVLHLKIDEEGFQMVIQGVSEVNAYVRLRIPHRIVKLTAFEKDNAIPVSWEEDIESQTLLINLYSDGEKITITGFWQ